MRPHTRSISRPANNFMFSRAIMLKTGGGKMEKVIIIGGGVAGLSAGIYGLLAGLDCTVIEKNKEVGGALCSWQRGDYTVDGCLHWLTGTKRGTELYKIWQDTGVLGNESETVRPQTLYTSYYGGEVLDFSRDIRKTRSAMHRISPQDAHESNAFTEAVRAAASLMGCDDSYSRVRALQLLAPYARLDLYALGRRFSSPHLHFAMTDFIGGEYNALGLIFAYAAFVSGNGDLPAGGSRGAAERMKKKFLGLGGTLVTGERVTGMRREGGRVVSVTTDMGDEREAEHFISCVPLPVTYRLTGGRMQPRGTRERRRRPLFSSFHIALSADADALPFRGTAVFSCEGIDIMGEHTDRLAIKEYSHEASFSPAGKNIIECMIFMREDACRRWIELRGSYNEYRDEKMRAAQLILKNAERAFPQLAGKLGIIDSWTPATFERYLGAPCGAYMGHAITGGALPYRHSAHMRAAENLLIASGWQQAPGGLPTAARMGRRAIEYITGQHFGST